MTHPDHLPLPTPCRLPPAAGYFGFKVPARPLPAVANDRNGVAARARTKPARVCVAKQLMLRY